MRINLRALTVPFCLALFWAFTAGASERGTQEEAMKLALSTAQHLEEAGPERAFSDFEDPDGDFFDRDLYVFVQDYNCTFFAHGLNPALKGKNIWDLKNPNGRYACRDIVEITRKDGRGWTDYIFQDPLSGKLAWKRTFSIGVGDYIVMVGAYVRNVDE